ncbi:hypothetical protein LCGC14_2648600 [marine sediment metagenome]|uniref:Uncharacterized protein n=1 Tax=marine sediment metagenome TaxID=412755 RepID=A0A0F8ZVJ1_9ZZZZ
MIKYVEVTLAIDDNNPSTVEVAHREKEDDGGWSQPTEFTESLPEFSLSFSLLHIRVVRI